jgi:hypothetical protein
MSEAEFREKQKNALNILRVRGCTQKTIEWVIDDEEAVSRITNPDYEECAGFKDDFGDFSKENAFRYWATAI